MEIPMPRPTKCSNTHHSHISIRCYFSILAPILDFVGHIEISSNWNCDIILDIFLINCMTTAYTTRHQNHLPITYSFRDIGNDTF